MSVCCPVFNEEPEASSGVQPVPRYRDRLPQLTDQVFLTDGGLETELIFMQGVDLPCFASFPLVMNEAGRDRLRRYFEPYLRTAQESGAGFVLDTVTWRANADWAARLGYSADELRRSIANPRPSLRRCAMSSTAKKRLSSSQAFWVRAATATKPESA